MELTIIKQEQKDQALQIDNSVSELLNSGLTGFALSLAKANVVEMISSALTSEILKPVMKMQNKPYGFKTDNKEGYKEEIIRDCLIQATLKGVEPTGNQFNIIGGNCYITKEGCTHILSKMGVFTEIDYALSVTTNDLTTIKTTITWTKNGKSESKIIVFPVKIHKGITTEEAIRGKAERKIKAWLIEHLTGQQIGDGDTDKTVDGTYEEIKTEKTTKETVVEVLTEVLKDTITTSETYNDNVKKPISILQTQANDYISKAKDLVDLEKRKMNISASMTREGEVFDETLFNELKAKFA